MKRIAITSLVALLTSLASPSEAGDVVVENKSSHQIKVASIGGSGLIPPKSSKSISFKNDENGADINIWWVKNARQLCQVYTPWQRTITVTGKYTIQCMSRK